MTRPAVSIIIPTFNRADTLPRALDSVLGQTMRDWEIVLVDDGSTDQTSSIAQVYRDKLYRRFQYVRQENRGCSAARNRGIDIARGKFIAFLDSDDEYTPTKLERQLELFRLHPDLGLVFSDYACVDLTGRRTESAFSAYYPTLRKLPLEKVATNMFACTRSLFDSLIRQYLISTIVGMVRREVLASGIRFSPELAYAEEWLFYLKVSKACWVGFVDEPLAIHHYTQGSLARTDRQRNSERLAALLLAIKRTFPDLTTSQRRSLHANLARVHHQIAYDAAKRNDQRTVTRMLRESLRYRVRPRVLWQWFRAAAGSMGDPPSSVSDSIIVSQDSASAVR